MSEENSPTDEQSTPHQGPGDRLQAARISIGMSIEEVAGKMHLSTSILSSLEENNFDDITAPIFVKGYLRAYSRMVNENEDEIIQQYARYYMDGDPPISSTSNTLPEINADDSRVKWVTWFIILLLVTLLGLWWWNRYQQPAETVSLDTTDQIEIAQHDQTLTPSESVATDADQALQKQTETLSATLDAGIDDAPKTSYAPPLDASLNDESASSQPLASQNAMPATNVPPEITDAPNADTTTGNDLNTSAPQLEASAQPAAEPPVTVPPQATSEQGLKLIVSADTWASIRDADGKKLLKDLLRAGETITLQGKPPLKVFLGNGYGASLIYNGKKVDFSDNIKPNNTARIVIGK